MQQRNYVDKSNRFSTTIQLQLHVNSKHLSMGNMQLLHLRYVYALIMNQNQVVNFKICSPICKIIHAQTCNNAEQLCRPAARKPPVVDGDEFVQSVRKVQYRTNCTTKTCLEFIQLFEQYLDAKLPTDFGKCDKVLKEAAGVDVLTLNGCPKCHGHVYGPKDKRTECPCCGAARYDANGKAHEVLCVWFCFLIVDDYFLFCFITTCFFTEGFLLSIEVSVAQAFGGRFFSSKFKS